MPPPPPQHLHYQQESHILVHSRYSLSSTTTTASAATASPNSRSHQQQQQHARAHARQPHNFGSCTPRYLPLVCLTLLSGYYLGSLHTSLILQKSEEQSQQQQQLQQQHDNDDGMSKASLMLTSSKSGRELDPNESSTSPFLWKRRIKNLQLRLQQCKKKEKDNEEKSNIINAVHNNIHDIPNQPLMQQQEEQQQQQNQRQERTADWLSSLQQQQQQQHEFCQALPYPTPTALSLWTAHVKQIHASTRLMPNDGDYKFHDFTARLLHIITPRLHLSVQSIPREQYMATSVLRLLDTLTTRWQYLKQNYQLQQQEQNGKDKKDSSSFSPPPTPPPPVRIVILGGSVLVGRNCRKLVTDLHMQGVHLPMRECTWAHRLEVFLNHMAWSNTLDTHDKDGTTAGVDFVYKDEYKLFQVTKVAMGGTNTAVGSLVLDYNLLANDAAAASNPDIIVNAYSTNNMHVTTIEDAQKNNATLRDYVFDMVQTFVRIALQDKVAQGEGENGPVPPPPPPECASSSSSSSSITKRYVPLLLHVDDYLGNEQRDIWTTTEAAQGVHVLADYYGFATASYASVVRQLVYGDTHEYWFSPQGWYLENDDNDKDASENDKNKDIMSREIHPGMGMHIAMTWIVAYNLLHIATQYCSMEPWLQQYREQYHRQQQRQSAESVENGNDDPDELPPYESSILKDFIPLRNDPYSKVPGKPKAHSLSVLPPPLTKTLSLEHVSALWQDAVSMTRKQRQQRGPAAANEVKAVPVKGKVNCESYSISLATREQGYSRCIFSWLSGMSLAQNNVTWIEEYFQNRTSTWTGWELRDDGGKLGFVPSSASTNNKNNKNSKNNKKKNAATTDKSNNRVELLFRNVSQPLRSVTFFNLRSYGPLWENSRLQVSVEVYIPPPATTTTTGSQHLPWLPQWQRQQQQPSEPVWHLLNRTELVGFHNKNTSEMYTDVITLEGLTKGQEEHAFGVVTSDTDTTAAAVPTGSTLRLSYQLVSGENFKIMGLAVCS